MISSIKRAKLLNKLLINRFSTKNEHPEIIYNNKNTEHKEETIVDTQTSDGDNKPTIMDVYEVKSKKLGPRDISKFIDTSKITNPNVSLNDNYDWELFGKDDFETINPTPVSSKLGPFEVILNNL
jgi:hypothetical protein